MDKPDQLTLEALYSQRNIHTVLHQAITFELDKLFLDWTLRVWLRIEDWLQGTYYKSKDERIAVLKQAVDERGMEHLIVAIAAAVLHTHNTQTIQQCVGYLQAYMPHDKAFDRARTAAELLGLCSKKKMLYKIKRHGSGTPATIKVYKWKRLNKTLFTSFEWINNTLFNIPLVEPPLQVTHNFRCGYHSLSEPLLLGRLVQHEERLNYDTINTLNQVEWILDDHVLTEAEVSAKPIKRKHKEKHEQFIQLVKESNFVYRLLDDIPFWLAWQYDSRGRVYSHGYHVNFQANQYKKALLSFNKFEYLT